MGGPSGPQQSPQQHSQHSKQQNPAQLIKTIYLVKELGKYLPWGHGHLHPTANIPTSTATHMDDVHRLGRFLMYCYYYTMHGILWV
jgi:hypothetical protein